MSRSSFEKRIARKRFLAVGTFVILFAATAVYYQGMQSNSEFGIAKEDSVPVMAPIEPDSASYANRPPVLQKRIQDDSLVGFSDAEKHFDTLKVGAEVAEPLLPQGQ